MPQALAPKPAAAGKDGKKKKRKIDDNAEAPLSQHARGAGKGGRGGSGGGSGGGRGKAGGGGRATATSKAGGKGGGKGAGPTSAPTAPSSAPASNDSSTLAQQALNRVLSRVGAKVISRKDMLVMYMGNCVEVLQHFKKQKKNKVSTTMMRSYFKTIEGAKVWQQLDIGALCDYEFDHIYPVGAGGGYEYPYNYFVMPKVLNNAPEFKYYGQEKETYIGPAVAKDARNFMRWIRSRAQNMIDMAEFEKERINM